MSTPKMGTIVHFYTETVSDQHNGQLNGPYPAIVTQAFGDKGMVNLKILPGFGPVRDEGSVSPKSESNLSRYWEPVA